MMEETERVYEQFGGVKDENEWHGPFIAKKCCCASCVLPNATTELRTSDELRSNEWAQ